MDELFDALFGSGKKETPQQRNERIKREHKARHGKSDKSKSSNRERNVGHVKGEEHSRNNKGSKKTGYRGTGGQPRR